MPRPAQEDPMSWKAEIEEIHRRRALAELCGGAAAVERHHAEGKLTGGPDRPARDAPVPVPLSRGGLSGDADAPWAKKPGGRASLKGKTDKM